MIDTIKFKIDIDRDLYRKIEKRSVEFRKFDHELNHEFVRILSKKFNVGSYDRHISITLYDDERIYMEFSLPKIFYGHNVYMISPEQVFPICEMVRKVLVSMFGYFPSISIWEINRIDFCYAWKLPSEYVAEQVLNIFRGITPPYKGIHNYDSSVMWYGRQHAIKFYLKYPEFYEHDFKELKKEGFTDRAYQFLNIAQGVLRFEVTLRNKSLVNEFYGRCSDKYVSLSKDVFNTKKCQTILNKYLYKVLKLRNVETMDNKTVYDKLIDAYGVVKARPIFLFYKLMFSPDSNEKLILKSYSRWQVYRYQKKLIDAGIGISADQLQVGFNFSIPSNYAVNFPTAKTQ